MKYIATICFKNGVNVTIEQNNPKMAFKDFRTDILNRNKRQNIEYMEIKIVEIDK